jgi:hypothetical protein
MTEGDLDWMHQLFNKRYPPPRYDAITTEAWYRNVILKTPLMFYPCRLANSFSVSMMTCVPWFPTEFETHVICVCAEDGAHWEAVKLLRASIAWARLRKCKRWRLSSDTEYEFGGLAKRLGATELSPRYTLEL